MSLPTDPEPPQTYAQDFAVNQLSDLIALLTYRSAHVGALGELFRYTNRSSIWQLESSGWRMVFHQGTLTDSFNQPAI
ncbi:hypothetical protein BWI75_09940 [Gloeocapsopsis sp. AAB1 = 1H9]|uniref:DUF4440 domain-containing protein n=1 Tax=Gloeocapsopsis dulcis AAB1 = 1H9 TaxID=1433147 RepID=A0A6N8FU73_9CHRO|nr:hypothetical protein [Gloeocapsopsis dulcis AAB1 = 1H9]